jgi:hypothetical protein
MPELFCPTHGPYDAALGACPFCSPGAGAGGYRPAPATPLGQDDMQTDPGIGGRRGGGGFPPPAGGGGFAPLNEEDVKTEFSRKPGGGRGAAGADDEESTQVGRRAKLDDMTELDVVDTTAQAILWVKAGPRRGRIYKIKEMTVVGRNQGDLMLDDPKISNQHCKFVFENGAYVLWDFGSRNGSFVNGERIRAATPLKENDEIKLGDSTFVLKILG